MSKIECAGCLTHACACAYTAFAFRLGVGRHKRCGLAALHLEVTL